MGVRARYQAMTAGPRKALGVVMMTLLVTASCGSRQSAPACRDNSRCAPAALQPCSRETGMSVAQALATRERTIAVHGRVEQGSVVCKHACGCSGGFILVDPSASVYLRLRGAGLGCTGSRGPMCCAIDALGEQVVARGTMQHDDRGVWLDGTTLCAAR